MNSAGRHDSGIVDQDGDRAEMRFQLGQGGRDLCRLTDIGLDFQSAAAISADFIDDGLTGGGLQIHNADRRSFSGKTRGNAAANSPRGAGDQGHFSF